MPCEFWGRAARAVAREQVAALRGNTHTLHSAVAVMRGGAVLFETVDAAHLTMRQFSDAFLDSYLDAVGDKALSSVGGYQLEGMGIQLFDTAGQDLQDRMLVSRDGHGNLAGQGLQVRLPTDQEQLLRPWNRLRLGRWLAEPA